MCSNFLCNLCYTSSPKSHISVSGEAVVSPDVRAKLCLTAAVGVTRCVYGLVVHGLVLDLCASVNVDVFTGPSTSNGIHRIEWLSTEMVL